MQRNTTQNMYLCTILLISHTNSVLLKLHNEYLKIQKISRSKNNNISK